jgi:metallo-beta-lactamase class B
MTRPKLSVTALTLTLLLAAQPVRGQEGIDWNARGPWHPAAKVLTGNWATYREQPFKLFDNVYFVGLKTVSSYLVTTRDGHVLIGATLPETASYVLDNIRSLGFDPNDVEYIVVTEGNREHAGGAARLKEATGARILLSDAAWDLVESADDFDLERDRVVADGEVIVLGGEAFKFYVTPGHTPGALTLEFMAYSPGFVQRAMVPGGLALDFGPELTDDYIRSVEWIRTLDPSLILPTHPHTGPVDIFATRAELADVDAKMGHPLENPAAVEKWLDDLLAVATEKQLAETRGLSREGL